MLMGGERERTAGAPDVLPLRSGTLTGRGGEARSSKGRVRERGAGGGSSPSSASTFACFGVFGVAGPEPKSRHESGEGRGEEACISRREGRAWGELASSPPPPPPPMLD